MTRKFHFLKFSFSITAPVHSLQNSILLGGDFPPFQVETAARISSTPLKTCRSCLSYTAIPPMTQAAQTRPIALGCRQASARYDFPGFVITLHKPIQRVTTAGLAAATAAPAAAPPLLRAAAPPSSLAADTPPAAAAAAAALPAALPATAAAAAAASARRSAAAAAAGCAPATAEQCPRGAQKFAPPLPRAPTAATSCSPCT